MRGLPIPIAVFDHSEDEFGDPVLVDQGNSGSARVEWNTPAGGTSGTHSWKALSRGTYFVTIQAETGPIGDRSNTEIEVLSPSVPQALVSAKVTTFKQLLVTRTYAPTTGGFNVTINASELAREWQPYQRLNGQWVVTMEPEDVFEFTVTNAETNKKFIAIIWRLNDCNVEFLEDPSLLTTDPGGLGCTIANISRAGSRKKRWRVTTGASVPGGGALLSWGFISATLKPGFAHEVRATLYPVSGSSGSAYLKVIENGSTTLIDQLLTYQTPPSSEYIHSFSAYTVGNLITEIQLHGIAANQTFDLEIQFNVL